VDVGVRPEGVKDMGPAIIVTGCMRATKHGDAEFDLQDAGPATALGEGSAPQGVRQYRVLGSAVDLKRHADQRVELIGLVQEGTSPDASAPLTLDAKSVRSTADKCSH